MHSSIFEPIQILGQFTPHEPSEVTLGTIALGALAIAIVLIVDRFFIRHSKKLFS